MVAVERLEEQHFVAGIEQRHGRGVQAAGGAGGDQDLGLGVVGRGRSRAAALRRWRCAGGRCRPGGCRCCGRRGWPGWRPPQPARDRGVADALGQVDAAHRSHASGHGADFRLDGGGGELAEGEAGGRKLRVVVMGKILVLHLTFRSRGRFCAAWVKSAAAEFVARAAAA